ncbi:ABC transporter substrate-binding protein [Mesorhizobium sp. CN2-181]|uniref:ABC transporter substrate-binding protein n=1 Tax=Mesorhizobium yinganensis TaxID=3157707 RepID=UPI0032B7A57B
MIKKTLLTCLGSALGALMISSAVAAPPTEIRLGLVTTLTTSAAAGGEATKEGIELAIEQLGSKIGGIPVTLFVEDDALNPALGKQKTEKLILQDRVDFLVGYNYSNVLLAAYKAAVDNQTFLLSTNAGPGVLAGKHCNPWFFAIRDQTEQAPRVMGDELNRKGVKRLYTMAPNYVAGKEMVGGLLSHFNGEVIGQDYTKWPDQLDFSSEIAKIKSAAPDAAYVFYPPAHALQFVSQFQQAGLKGKIPLYSNYTFDGLTLPQLGALADGSLLTMFWSVDLDNEANRRFVDAFKKKHGREPSNFAASAYDAIMLIDSAVRGVDGEMSDKDKLREALEAANFQSVRGKFRFGTNHFPIQDFYLLQVVPADDGTFTTKTLSVAATENSDTYVNDCQMK